MGSPAPRTVVVVVPFFNEEENLEALYGRLSGALAAEPATVVALILFLGGVQLLSLGLMGQYIGRIYEESKKRPLYFVKEKLGTFGPRAGEAPRA